MIGNAMLACQENVTPDNLQEILNRGPVGVTPKIDGIRVRILKGENGELTGFSRKELELRNAILQDWISEQKHLEGCDGEVVGKGLTFHLTQSKVMTKHTMPWSWFYFIFDNPMIKGGYLQRLQKMKDKYKFNPTCRFLFPEICKTKDDVLNAERRWLEAGFEGLILRSLDGPYKHGRATWNEGYMFKMKRFIDAEAVVLSIHPRLHNQNEATTDRTGYTKRSKHQANLSPLQIMGRMTVRDLVSGKKFSIGSGWDQKFAQECWDNPDEIVGQIITYKKQIHGELVLPRTPIFKGVRYD